MAGGDNVIRAFTAEQVVRLTGLSKRQLAEWDRIGFFAPQYAVEDRRSHFSRIYSFKDVVGLRTISLLRGGYAVPLKHLKEVAAELSKRMATWADVRLYVWNRQVCWDDPETGKPIGVTSGQYALLEISDIMTEMRQEAERLNRRDQSEIGKIERHRYVAHNAAVVAGTRIRVSTIMRFVEAGYTASAIVAEFPSLTEADVEGVIRQQKSGAAA
ncbi:DUF433 domain-containing protein [Magnetospirillum sp. UT-4]|uniref:DUF433 domain-containing protein n=1 Tax=Magnetospirillum sp. UT-4 TaxID=2681467 RepID=UPI00137D0EFC|nr:DUF433 domain-containing protein [Magnetospirillum sp. UT-4]CAA7619380.1 conserved hypothetical protein [Magnetospirillum sp. UT-4]